MCHDYFVSDSIEELQLLCLVLTESSNCWFDSESVFYLLGINSHADLVATRGGSKGGQGGHGPLSEICGPQKKFKIRPH